MGAATWMIALPNERTAVAKLLTEFMPHISVRDIYLIVNGSGWRTLSCDVCNVCHSKRACLKCVGFCVALKRKGGTS